MILASWRKNPRARQHWCYSVISYQADNVLLDGVTVTGGRVLRPPVETRGGTGGGAIVIRDSSPTINNCTFRGNTAEVNAGAVFISGGHPTFNNCTFAKNYAGGSGGAIGRRRRCDDQELHFNSNGASAGGAVAEFAGTISNCVFRGNSAKRGGALTGCNGLITSCLFAGNSASEHGGAVDAGYRDSPTFKNCVFTNNRATRMGGGLFIYYDTTAVLVNCTFSGNSGIDGNALASYSWHSQHPPNKAILTSCVLWDGGREIWKNDDSTIIVNYSDVFGGYSGVGNIDLDPLFADANNGDFHLKSQGGDGIRAIRAGL